jgi:hypothetical protein
LFEEGVMARIIAHPVLDLKVVIELSEGEVRALDAMAGYGEDEFVKAFYEKLGEGYMREHEVGLRSFLGSVRSFTPAILGKMDQARKSFGG